MKNILLIEDNPKYIHAAEQYLVSKGLEVTLSKDYSEAMERLRTPQFEGIITDCFFPEMTGSGNITLGRELVERMAQSDPHERNRIEGMKVLEQYIDLSDPEIREYSLILVDSYGHKAESPIVQSLEIINRTIGKEFATEIAKKTFRSLCENLRKPKDHYTALRNAMIESEAQQPLGILVAEKAIELGIPVVLATSTFHHDILTQPIQNYASKNGLRLVDCGEGKENDKATPVFWETVLAVLEKN